MDIGRKGPLVRSIPSFHCLRWLTGLVLWIDHKEEKQEMMYETTYSCRHVSIGYSNIMNNLQVLHAYNEREFEELEHIH
jgi:hypothetical protein